MSFCLIFLSFSIFEGFASASPRIFPPVRQQQQSIPLPTPFSLSSASSSDAFDELRKRQTTTQISTCGYDNGDPTKPREGTLNTTSKIQLGKRKRNATPVSSKKKPKRPVAEGAVHGPEEVTEDDDDDEEEIHQFRRVHVLHKNLIKPVAAPSRVMDDDHDNISSQLNDDDSVAGDMALPLASNTLHRLSAMKGAKEQIKSKTEQDHEFYSDELLDYFMLPNNYAQVRKPKLPFNYQLNWIIDSEGHTAIHWACATGHIEVVKELRNFGADLAAQNYRGETPLMRCVLFTNCMDRQAMLQWSRS